MFVVFYIVNLYICVYMTCSTSYCLYDTRMYPWNKYVCVCWKKRMCMPTKRKSYCKHPPPKSKLFVLSWDKFVAERQFKQNLLYVLLPKKNMNTIAK